MAGDFILAVASMMIARLGDDDVTQTLSQVVNALFFFQKIPSLYLASLVTFAVHALAMVPILRGQVT